MKRDDSYILTINGVSSSIKFASYQAGEALKRELYGKLDRIGLKGTILTFQDTRSKKPEIWDLDDAFSKLPIKFLIDWLEGQKAFDSLRAVGYRVVHGMQHTAPELATPELLDELRRVSPIDLDHLPREIELIKAFCRHHPKLPRIACPGMCPEELDSTRACHALSRSCVSLLL